MKNRVNIGTASIILIFIILCLSVFSLLSLSDGNSALVLARRRADSVTAYYQTDSAGQEFIQAVVTALDADKSAEEALSGAAGTLPDGADTGVGEDGRIYCEIPMNAGQALRIELDSTNKTVLACYVYNRENYAIDDSLPVWIAPEE